MMSRYRLQAKPIPNSEWCTVTARGHEFAFPRTMSDEDLDRWIDSKPNRYPREYFYEGHWRVLSFDGNEPGKIID